MKKLNRIWKKYGFPYKLRLKDLTLIEMEILEKNKNGYFDGQRIHINKELDKNKKIATIFHELTHFKNKNYFKKVKDLNRLNWEFFLGQNKKEILKIKKKEPWLDDLYATFDETCAYIVSFDYEGEKNIPKKIFKTLSEIDYLYEGINPYIGKKMSKQIIKTKNVKEVWDNWFN